MPDKRRAGRGGRRPADLTEGGLAAVPSAVHARASAELRAVELVHWRDGTVIAVARLAPESAIVLASELLRLALEAQAVARDPGRPFGPDG